MDRQNPSRVQEPLHRSPLWGSFTLCLLLLAGPLVGEPCRPDESFDDCIDRLHAQDEAPKDQEAAVKETTDEQTQTTAEAVQERTTASNDPLSGTSLRNLLPSILTSLGIDGVSESDGNLTVDYTPKMGEACDDPKKSCWRPTFKAVIQNPEIFAGLKEEIPEEDRSDRVSSLESELGDFDQVDLSVTLSLQKRKGDRRIGRSLASYQSLLTSLYNEVFEEATAELGKQTTADREYEDLLKELDIDPETPIAELLEAEASQCQAEHSRKAATTLAELSQTNCSGDRACIESLAERLADSMSPEPCEGSRQMEEKIAQLQEAVLEIQTSRVGHSKARKAIEEEHHFEAITALVSNQPQAFIEGTYKERGDLSGPTSWNIKASYEMGFSNVNDLMSWTPRDDSSCKKNQVPSLDCLKAYMEHHQAYEKEDRLAFSLSYSTTDSYTSPLTDIALETEETQSWIGSLTWGRYLRFDDQRQPTSRIDIKAEYEDVEGSAMETMKNSRFVATVTFTQKMIADTALSFSLVYANRPEFLGEVDEELGANLGLRWKLDTGE